MSALVEGIRGSRDTLCIADSSNHWHQFGLECSPFDDSLSVYYPVLQWEEHLNYLQRFRAGPYPLLLIPGIVGAGKTTLLKRFVELQNDPARIHYIEAEPHHAVNQLIRPLYAHGDASTRHDANIPEVLNQLGVLSKEVGSQLLLIDDAHRLPRETLMRLLHLLFEQDLDQSQLRVILCGESQLQEVVMTLLDGFASGRQVPSLELEPFSIQEIREYLEFRLTHAGLSEKLPFTPALLKQVHVLSGGYPGRVNRVAQQVLVDMMKSSHKRRNAQAWMSEFLDVHKVKLMSAIVLFSVSFLLWQFQPSPQTSRSVTADKSAANLAALKASLSGKKGLTLPEHEFSDEAAAQVATGEGLSQDVREAIAAAVDHIQVAEAGIDQSEELLSMPVVRNQHLCQGAVLADSSAMLAERTVPSTAPVSTIAAATKDLHLPQIEVATAGSVSSAEQKLMASKGYTIQVMGVRSPELFDTFITENKLARVSYYRTKLNNQDWYVLVYGNYQSPEQAKSALAALPAGVKKQHPWVRSFKGIQQAIEIAHEKEPAKASARVAVR
jgi:DamX protein